MQHLRILVFVTSCALCILACGKVDKPEGVIYEVLSPNDFESKLKLATNIQLIDARTPAEVANGQLSGALNYDYKADGIDKAIKELDKTKPVFIYCGSGIRSRKSADMMIKAGFTEIYDMEGGMKAWLAAGKTVE